MLRLTLNLPSVGRGTGRRRRQRWRACRSALKAFRK